MALDSVVLDMFGKSATAITDHPTFIEILDPAHYVSLSQHSLKTKSGTVIESIEEYSITNEKEERIGIVRDHLSYPQNLIERTVSCITRIVKKTKMLSHFCALFRVSTEILPSPSFPKSTPI